MLENGTQDKPLELSEYLTRLKAVFASHIKNNTLPGRAQMARINNDLDRLMPRALRLETDARNAAERAALENQKPVKTVSAAQQKLEGLL